MEARGHGRRKSVQPTNDGWANQGKFGVSGKDRRS
jgi:hypothetical protein